ncbi:MAG: hypothetical protein Q9169_005187 [Polycauliona sp. 2 TL-2023]
MFEGHDTPERIATRIDDIYNPALKAGSKGCVFNLWAMICQATQILGNDMGISMQLVQLINALRRLPDVVDDEGRPIQPAYGWWGMGVYWRDLPVLGISFSEYFGTCSPLPPFVVSMMKTRKRICLPQYGSIDIDQESGEHEPADFTAAQRRMLLGMTTFGALYILHGEADLGMSYQCDISLAENIEQPSYPTWEEQRRADRAVVPAAATWILIAGQELYDRCKTGVVVIRERQYNLERWALWKRKFSEIAVNRGLTDDVNEYAGRAVARMTEIEETAVSEIAR